MRKFLKTLWAGAWRDVVLPGWLFYLLCATLIGPAIYRVLKAMLGLVL